MPRCPRKFPREITRSREWMNPKTTHIFRCRSDISASYINPLLNFRVSGELDRSLWDLRQPIPVFFFVFLWTMRQPAKLYPMAFRCMKNRTDRNLDARSLFPTCLSLDIDTLSSFIPGKNLTSDERQRPRISLFFVEIIMDGSNTDQKQKDFIVSPNNLFVSFFFFSFFLIFNQLNKRYN